MKNFRILFLCFSLLAIGTALTSCGHSHDKTTEMEGKEYTSAYICPMYCTGSGSEEAGKCPVCNMDYVKNENQDADAGDHDGHDHGAEGHEGHNH